MHDVTNAAWWLQLLGALLVAGLGAFVLTIRPRTVPNVGFAAFALGFGAQFALTNVGHLFFDYPSLGAPAPFEAFRLVLRLLAVAGLVAVGLTFPAPLRPGGRRLLVLPLVVAGAILVYGGMGAVRGAVFGSLSVLDVMVILVFFAMTGGLVALLSLLALRAAASRDARFASQAALVAGALVLYAGFAATAGFEGERATSILSPDSFVVPWLALHLVAVVVAAALWLRAAARGPAPRAARNAALATLAAPLAGLVYAAVDVDVGALGVVRTLAVAVLAYGIVRHQLLGVDVKVRWTIRQSTIGAAFIAVFFIVSEGPSVFFGDDNEYLGVLAAGALVFALAPLQRVAERVAHAAVPVMAPPVPAPGDGREAAYRAAVRFALRDRALTRAEELDVARIAEELGVGARRALEIRHEVEAEVAR